MKKLFLALILLFSIAIPTFTHASSNSITLKVNNKEVDQKYSPMVIDETTYVPLNEIANLMGEEVTSISYQKKVMIRGKSGFLVSVKDGQTTAIVNGRLLPLKTRMVDGQEVNANSKAIYKNEQVYVPIEFIGSGNGMTYPVETINETETTIYIGELPASVKDAITKKTMVLKINNNQVSSKLSPFVSDGTTYVPVKEIAKQMGGNPGSTNNEVQVELSGLTFVTVTAGKSTASIYDSQLMSRDRTRIVPLKTVIINGNNKNVNAKAIIKNNEIFVPIEFISSTNGLDYYVQAVKEKTKITIYVGELPSSLQQSIKKYGYATEWELVNPKPKSIKQITSIVKNQQVYIYSQQGNMYKIKVGKHIGYVDRKTVKIGKSPAKGKMYSDGWFAPSLKSKWSKDSKKNYKILENELGFTNGGSRYGIFGQSGAVQVIGQGPSASYEVGLRFSMWDGDANGQMPQAYRIPIVAKELFKLYFEKDASRVWNYFNRGDIPDKFTANGRKVTASYSKADGTIYLSVGHKK